MVRLYRSEQQLTMDELTKIEVPIEGMDCAECSMHVQRAIASLPGVETVDVFLTTEKALIELDPEQVDLSAIRQVVGKAGYAVPVEAAESHEDMPEGMEFTRSVLTLLGLVFGAVLFVVLVGEWLGVFEALTERIPWYIGLALVLISGFPVFRKVIQAAFRGQIISHTLMTLGVVAALAVGEWATAVVVVFFMRIGDYVESFTTERARRAVKDLSSLAPQMARVMRPDGEIEVPIEDVKVGDVVLVRPGEVIPVDGQVIAGGAAVDQATITGESMPIDAGPGSHVFAATLASGGRLSVRAKQIGKDTTFGQVIKLVEGAEAHRADVQRVADKFSAYYLPVVAGIAALTFLIRRDPLATAAVLVVACSCAFALATPVAMLASIGAGARRGLMIKGGKYLELLDRADTLLIDKTGTLTLGQPEIVDIRLLDDLNPAIGFPVNEEDRRSVLQLAASAERYSEHPLAKAVCRAAEMEGLDFFETGEFEAFPGLGVRAFIDRAEVTVGNRRLFKDHLDRMPGMRGFIEEVESQGRSILLVALDGELKALMTAADRLRSEVPQAIEALRRLGLGHVELLTGDHEQAARSLIKELVNQMEGDTPIEYRAGLLPGDKIEIVKTYQAQGRRVVMVGDGVNDAPALAQADVGIAMGAAGSDIAVEAAHIALMRDDWLLVPQVFQIARRTMRVVKMNIAFTAVYNLVGLTLAALGFLPPVFAAAAQSIPDLGIMANSSRLLRQK
jgi:Cd2+/Zn2+-exporting ATPase/Cu+-exporting ATPase